MTYDEYKQHLENCGPLDDVAKGLLSAFELGYAQGLKEGTQTPKEVREAEYSVLFHAEQDAENGIASWGLENAVDSYLNALKKAKG